MLRLSHHCSAAKRFANSTQEYTVDIYLGMAWRDPRLALGIKGTNGTLSLSGGYVEKFWIPDMFFVNSVHTEVHRMLLPNKKLLVDLAGGNLMLSARSVKRVRHNVMGHGGNTYLTSLPVVSGNTYLTSLPLVSVHRHGRVTR